MLLMPPKCLLTDFMSKMELSAFCYLCVFPLVVLVFISTVLPNLKIISNINCP